MAEHRRVSVREFLASEDSQSITELMAFYLIYPEPQERADLRAGHIAAGMYNAWRGSTQSPASPWDYVYKTPATLEDVDGPGQAERTANTMQAMAMMRG